MQASDSLDLDFAKLLAPISAEAPAGVDLRLDPSPRALRRQIRQIYDENRAIERYQEAPDPNKNSPYANRYPDWKSLLKLAKTALEEKSKDLEIAVFLTQALVRTNGLAGLGACFHLTRELCDRFWDGLYPSANGSEDLGTRLKPLTDLNDAPGMILQPIYRQPITESTPAGGPFDCSNFKQAVDLTGKDEATRQDRISRGVKTLDTLKKAAAASEATFFAQSDKDAEKCLEELVKLDNVLTAKCGKDAPPSLAIRKALEEYRDALKTVAGDKLKAAEASTNSAAVLAIPVKGGATSNSAGAALANREQAFETLLKVAEFFHRTEPHTPISYALEEAVRWGRMNLPDLLTDLIPDETARKEVFKRVGIKPPATQ